MRIVVDARSLEPRGRMAMAAAALAARGHPVTWFGAAAPDPAIPEVAGNSGLARTRADLVVAGSRTPFRSGLATRRSGSAVLVLDLDPARARAWSLPQRWAVGSLDVSALVAPADADAVRSSRAVVPLDRIGLWSDEAPATVPDAAHADTEVLERACERAFRRHRGRAPLPAVFLDRDGTLVVERGYLTDAADIELLPGVPEALRRLSDAGYLLVVVSNQSGVGRGFFSAATVYAAMARLRATLRGRGVELDAIYFCPHRPEAGCACRKPGTQLLERARDDQGISLARSAMVGDKRIDSETGRRAGGRGLLVRTGYGRDEEQRAVSGGEPAPNAVVDDLAGAADWILGYPGAAKDR